MAQLVCSCDSFGALCDALRAWTHKSFADFFGRETSPKSPTPETREWVGGLVTVMEALLEEVTLSKRELAAERRDQGSGSGRPPGGARGSRGTARQERSNRANRANEPRQRVQRVSRAALTIHAERVIPVDPALLQGVGWQRWGYEERVIQDVRLTVHNTRYRLEK